MSKKLTLSQIQERSNLIHDYKYDLSEFVYVNNKTKSLIKCPEHGYFKQNINNHLSLKQGCPECKKNNLKVRNLKSVEVFKKELFEKFNDKFKFNEGDFKGYSSKCKFVCEQHGSFYITPYNLLNSSYGCGFCARELQNTNVSNNTEFIEKSNIVHENVYDYSLVDYVNNRQKVTIICPKHGKFQQVPMNHLTGSGCQKCSNNLTSKAEIEVYEFLKEHVECDNSNRVILNGKELDIYIPKLNIAVEFNGLYWHSDLFKDKNFHTGKTELCESKNIQLIHIFEDEWIFKKEIVKSRLLNLIGKTPVKIYARKCEIREVSSSDSMKFLEQNHIQGSVGSQIKLGLYCNEELVSLMTFGSLRKHMGQSSKAGVFELLRFCNKLNTNVIGGASKLLKYFERNYNPIEIISYADRRWSQGKLYSNLGFDFVHNTQPNYFYVQKGYCKRNNRYNFRKSELVKQGHDKNKTEKEIMKSLGYDRVYDSGNKKYKLIIQKYSEETLF